MKEPILKHLHNFLEKNLSPRRSILLGLSGGSDSLALFHLLQICRKKSPFTLGLAHIDHGWREESAEEARLLEKLANAHGLDFHLKRLSFDKEEKNLEAKGRENRLRFFEELCIDRGYQAVLLAHHLDDQAETVLKNIFEGANLYSCNGISDKTNLGSLELWRPLLSFSKNELASFSDKESLNPFIDATNFDKKFLRGRMRTEIFPSLELLFGKQIKQSLARQGADCEELKCFMQQHLSEILNKSQTTKSGIWIDLSSKPFLSLFELKFIIRTLSQKQGSFFSREIIHEAAIQLQKKATNKQFVMGKTRLYVDRMRLFITNDQALIADKTSCTKKISMIIREEVS